MVRFEGLKSYILGKFTQKQHLVYFFITMLIFFVGMLIAYLLFPIRYSMDTQQISTLGSPFENPIGHYFFNIACCITGILMIPTMFYFFRKLMPTAKLLTIFVFLFMLVGCFGLFILGIFYEELHEPHMVAATTGFGGLNAAAFFSFFVIVRKKMLKEKWPSYLQIFLIYGGWFLSMLTILLLFNSVNIHVFEWTTFWITFYWFVGFALIS